MYVLPLDTSRLQCFIVLAAVTTIIIIIIIIIIIVVVLVVVVTDMDSHSVTCSNQLVFFLTALFIITWDIVL